MSLDQITPATATLDATPSDVLAAAFPKHGLMVDPDAGVWIKGSWFPSEAWPTSAPCTAPDCPEHARPAEPVDVVAHLHVDEVPTVHPEDLPACLPTRRQMLDDVFRYPLRDVVAAIGVTGSAEPGVLLNAMVVKAA
jgi:hypothetical protein